MSTEEFVEKAKKELAKEKGGAVWLAMIELSDYIVFSAIAKNYFKKSSNWILQRLHGYEVNGKPAQFKPEEITIFVQALRDIAAKLEEEHKQRNEEHFRKKAIADKAREEKEEANKPVDVVVKPVKKNKAKVKVEENEE